MTNQSTAGPRCIDVSGADVRRLSNGIENLYDGSVDLLVARGVVPAAPLATVAAALDGGGQDPGWNRPNAVMPPEDIHVLGTAATPTYSTPQGPSLAGYLDDAGWYGKKPI